MSKPIIEEQIGGYQFVWKEEDLAIAVSKLKSHNSDGRITGEILIKAPAENPQPIYPQTSVNFTSERSRTGLVKTLESLDSHFPWQEIISQLSLATIDRARTGEEVQELWTHRDVPKLEFLLEPVIIKGVPNIIFGEKGVTKSTLSLVFYICLILPWTDNPLGLVAPNRSIKTLVLDYELPGDIAQRNAKQLQEGMDLPAFPLYHRRCFAPLAEEIEQIANHVNNMKAECVIIDSMARACGGELNKTEPANAYFEALDKLKVSSLSLGQTSKDIESKRKSIYGNALFTYYGRNIFELCKSETMNENELDVALFHRDSNLTKHYPNMSFHFTFNEHKTTIERQPINITEFIQKVSIKKAILEQLKQGALPAKDIATAITSSESAVKMALSRLNKQGLVVRLGSGLWGLQEQNNNE